MRTCRLSLRLPERFFLGLAGPFCFGGGLGMVASTSVFVSSSTHVDSAVAPTSSRSASNGWPCVSS